MFPDVKATSGEILTLLQEREGPVSVREVKERVGVSIHLMNLSLAALVREHQVGIETKDGENFIVRASRELLPMVAKDT
jgi:hypothetical protein